MPDYFIQKAVQRPGRVKGYIRREYGSKGFTKKGTIKEGYLEKAEERARENGERSLEDAIVLAKRLKKYSKEKQLATA